MNFELRGSLPQPLQAMQADGRVLLIFLRHFGWTFCREALADIARDRAAIEATGTQVAFVHMSPPEEADDWFARYGVADLTRISDPDKALYRQFELEEGSVFALMHPRVWLPWLRTAVVEGRGVGAAGPNWRQLTGVFVIRSGQILSEIRHGNSAARPDYLALLRRPGV